MPCCSLGNSTLLPHWGCYGRLCCNCSTCGGAGAASILDPLLQPRRASDVRWQASSRHHAAQLRVDYSKESIERDAFRGTRSRVTREGRDAAYHPLPEQALSFCVLGSRTGNDSQA